MGFFKKIKKLGKKLVKPAVAYGASMNPYTAWAVAAYSVYSGVSSYYKGKKLKKRARREGDLAMSQAAEYAEYMNQQGALANQAAMAQAHAAGRQAHMLKEAAAAAAALGEENAQNILSEGKEVVSRLKKDHRSLEGEANARLWASGIQGNEGSAGRFQKSLNKENRHERDWVKETFAKNAEIARQGGEIDAKQLAAAAAGAGGGAAAAAIQGQLALAEAQAAGKQAISDAGVYAANLKAKYKGGLGNLFKGLGGAALSLYAGGAFGGGGGGGGWFGATSHGKLIGSGGSPQALKGV